MAENQAKVKGIIEETAQRVLREWKREVANSGIDSNLVDRLVAQRDRENSIIEHILRNNPEMDQNSLRNHIDNIRRTLRGEENQNIELPSTDSAFGISNLNQNSPNADPGAILEANNSLISDSAAGAPNISHDLSPSPLDFILSMAAPREDFMPNSDSSTNIISYFNNYGSSLSELSSNEIGHLFHVIYAILVIFCALDITMLLYGNYLITRFAIETRFPRFSRILRLRKKLVNFNLATLIIVLFVSSFFVIFMNY